MRKVIFLSLALHIMAGSAYSQGFLALRVGTNLVGNTYRVRESKAEPGAGGSVGAMFSPYWAVELETWVRASNPECCGPRHRETLYSLSASGSLREKDCSRTCLAASRGSAPTMPNCRCR
jgi:hypothetical protein